MPFLAAIPAIAGTVATAIGSAATTAATALGTAATAVGTGALGALKGAGHVATQAAHGLGQVATTVGKPIAQTATKAAQQVAPSVGRGEFLQGLSKADLSTLASKGISLTGQGQNIAPSTIAQVAKTPTVGSQLMARGKGMLQGAFQGQGKGGEEEAAYKPQPLQQFDPMEMFAQIIASGQTPMGMQEGGLAPPGTPVIVGEAGPEVAVGGAEGMAVEPMEQAPETPTGAFKVAQPVQAKETTRQKVMDRLYSGLVGLTDVNKLQAMRSAHASRQKWLATMGIQHPVLLRTSPEVVEAVDSLSGPGSAQKLVDEGNPNVQAKMLAEMYGIPILPGGNELAQLSDVLATQGWGTTVTSKGELRINRSARSAEQQDAIRAFGDYNVIVAELQQQGVPHPEVQAAQRVLQIGPAAGYAVPKPLQDLAMAPSTITIEAAKTAATEAARQGQQVRFAGAKARAAEEAKRDVRLNMPITSDEIQARGAIVAGEMGGTVLGRDPSDDDLATMEQQGFVLLQQPNGMFIAVPESSRQNDPVMIKPRELLARRVALKIATQTTVQKQNANIVLSALNDVDEQDALSLLVPVAPTGPSLGETVVGAVKTEIAGQTVGRLSVWAYRRSSDKLQQDKAIALINLQTLTTPFVKAMGDVNAITEADKAIIKQRFDRIAMGLASQQEAVAQMNSIRRIMTLVVSKGEGEIKKGSTEAAELSGQIHDILIEPNQSANTPPPGYKRIPGMGGFWQYVP